MVAAMIPLPFTGASSDCHRCHHSFRHRCRHFCCFCCHDRRRFFCCCLLLIVVAVAVAPLPSPSPLLLPLSLLSPSHLPLPPTLLVDCCLYTSAAITVSSSSPRPLSSCHPTPALLTTSGTSSPLPLSPQLSLPCVFHRPLLLLVVVVCLSPLVASSAILVVVVNFVVSWRERRHCHVRHHRPGGMGWGKIPPIVVVVSVLTTSPCIVRTTSILAKNAAAALLLVQGTRDVVSDGSHDGCCAPLTPAPCHTHPPTTC